jgi:hypothetical protein
VGDQRGKLISPYFETPAAKLSTIFENVKNLPSQLKEFCHYSISKLSSSDQKQALWTQFVYGLSECVL